MQTSVYTKPLITEISSPIAFKFKDWVEFEYQRVVIYLLWTAIPHSLNFSLLLPAKAFLFFFRNPSCDVSLISKLTTVSYYTTSPSFQLSFGERHIIYINKNVNVRLYKTASLRKFFSDCFEIRGSNCIEYEHVVIYLLWASLPFHASIATPPPWDAFLIFFPKPMWYIIRMGINPFFILYIFPPSPRILTWGNFYF